jgi:hypothetical protein
VEATSAADARNRSVGAALHFATAARSASVGAGPPSASAARRGSLVVGPSSATAAHLVSHPEISQFQDVNIKNN